MLSGGKAKSSVKPVGLRTMTASPAMGHTPVLSAGPVETRLLKSRRIWQRSEPANGKGEFLNFGKSFTAGALLLISAPLSILLKVNMQFRVSVDVDGNSGFYNIKVENYSLRL